MYWNPKSITSSGGEPMIREDFFDIASFLRENYTGIITLSTNVPLSSICSSFKKLNGI